MLGRNPAMLSSFSELSDELILTTFVASPCGMTAARAFHIDASEIVESGRPRPSRHIEDIMDISA